MVERGAFRQDLLFRISGVRIVVPPLRERGEDLPLLAQQILADAAQTADRRIQGFTPAAMAAIHNYPWPGNIRELRQAIHHAMVIGEGPWIEAQDLPPGIAPTFDVLPDENPTLVRLPAKLAWLERVTIRAALREAGGNRTKAALLLGINRQTLYNKLSALAES